MPFIKELKNKLNLDKVSNDFETWHIYPKVTNNVR
jgi:hypothetical protein